MIGFAQLRLRRTKIFCLNDHLRAEAVAKDTISGQACKEELEKTQSILELTETKVKLIAKVILTWKIRNRNCCLKLLL